MSRRSPLLVPFVGKAVLEQSHFGPEDVFEGSTSGLWDAELGLSLASLLFGDTTVYGALEALGLGSER